MTKEGSIEFQGVVLELLPNEMFKVKEEGKKEENLSFASFKSMFSS